MDPLTRHHHLLGMAIRATRLDGFPPYPLRVIHNVLGCNEQVMDAVNGL